MAAGSAKGDSNVRRDASRHTDWGRDLYITSRIQFLVEIAGFWLTPYSHASSIFLIRTEAAVCCASTAGAWLSEPARECRTRTSTIADNAIAKFENILKTDFAKRVHDSARGLHHAGGAVHLAGRHHDYDANSYETEFLDAGCLFKAEHLPSLHLSLEVTRGQFSDMLLMLEAGRSAAYLFLEYWPIERVDYAGMTGLPGVCGPGTCRAGTTVVAPNTCFS